MTRFLAAVLMTIAVPILIVTPFAIAGWLDRDEYTQQELKEAQCETVYRNYGSLIRDTETLQLDDPERRIKMRIAMEVVIDNPQCYSSQTVQWAKNVRAEV